MVACSYLAGMVALGLGNFKAVKNLSIALWRWDAQSNTWNSSILVHVLTLVYVTKLE